jgi:hypothetical protein
MWSQQLGGSVSFVAGESEITYFQQTFLNGSETAAGELFNGTSTATLVCVDRCPSPGPEGITAEGLEAGMTYPSNMSETVSYNISNTGSDFLTLMEGSNPVVIAEGEDLSSIGYGWGFNTGAMVTLDVAEEMSNPWVVYSNQVSVFYTWETGEAQWNRTTIARDSQNEIMTFEKPLQFAYTHSDANDRSGSALHHGVDYAGQTFLLNYGGNGDFWGIPEDVIDTDDNGVPDRWMRKFAIADGAAMGPTGGEYVIKARDVEQTFSEVEMSNCSGLTLTTPTTALPTAVTGTLNNASIPTVTDAPKVIAGEIQSE